MFEFEKGQFVSNQLLLSYRFVSMDPKLHHSISFLKPKKGDFVGLESNGTSPSFLWIKKAMS